MKWLSEQKGRSEDYEPVYRMSLKEEIDVKYPYLEDDLYTSNMAKELLAKYLDSYLQFLTRLDPSIQVRIIKNYDIVRYLFL